MKPPKPLKVFLSYANTDREPARRISDHLKQAGLEVWDAERELLPGSDWAASLQEALDTSQAMVVLVSPESVESRQVAREIEYALGARHMSGRLIPVLLRSTREMPWILRELKMIRYGDPARTGEQIVEALTGARDAPDPKRKAE
jgi:hypothetical protein